MKKIKNLIVAGCSFMGGASLTLFHNPNDAENLLTPDEQMKKRFSKILSEKLNSNEINLAKPGGSNELSIRLIYDWVTENEDEVQDSVFIIGLTELLRKEKFSEPTKEFLKWRNTIFYSNLNKLNDKEFKTKLIMGSPNFKKYLEENNLYDSLKLYCKLDVLLFTDLNYEFKTLSRNLNMLNSYIKERGGRLIVFAAMLELDDLLKKQFGIVGNLNLNKLEFFTFPNNIKCWKTYIKSYDENYGLSRHPCVEDDKKLADLFYQYLNQ